MTANWTKGNANKHTGVEMLTKGVKQVFFPIKLKWRQPEQLPVSFSRAALSMQSFSSLRGRASLLSLSIEEQSCQGFQAFIHFPTLNNLSSPLCPLPSHHPLSFFPVTFSCCTALSSCNFQQDTGSSSCADLIWKCSLLLNLLFGLNTHL